MNSVSQGPSTFGQQIVGGADSECHVEQCPFQCRFATYGNARSHFCWKHFWTWIVTFMISAGADQSAYFDPLDDPDGDYDAELEWGISVRVLSEERDPDFDPDEPYAEDGGRECYLNARIEHFEDATSYNTMGESYRSLDQFQTAFEKNIEVFWKKYGETLDKKYHVIILISNPNPRLHQSLKDAGATWNEDDDFVMEVEGLVWRPTEEPVAMEEDWKTDEQQYETGGQRTGQRKRAYENELEAQGVRGSAVPSAFSTAEATQSNYKRTKR